MNYSSISKVAVIWFTSTTLIGFSDSVRAAQVNRSILQVATPAKNVKKKLNLSSQDSVLLSQLNNFEEGASDESIESMRYLELGLNAHSMYEKTGLSNYFKQSLSYYYEALKLDRKNAYAFMGAGMLVGNTKEGSLFMMTAATLFYEQGNDEWYQRVIQYLKTLN